MKQTIRPSRPPATAQRVPSGGARNVWPWFVTWRGELAALALFAFALIVRAPWVLVFGRFWAEEGTVFLSYAWTHSFLDALTAPHLGYYNFIPTVAGILGAHVPLEWAPRLTVAMGLPIQMLPAALILFTTIPGLVTPMRKGMALLLLLVVPSSPEVLLSTALSHMVLCVVTALILISALGGRIDRVCKWILLGLAGLTGVVSIFLTPLFWVQWWRERRRERVVQALILTCCALLQVIAASRALSAGERSARFDPTVMVGAWYAKFILTPLAPARIAYDHLDRLSAGLSAGDSLSIWVWMVTIVLFAGFLFACWRAGDRAALLLVAASLWVAFLSFVLSTGPDTRDKLIAHLNFGLRYYYAPQILFFLAVMVCIRPGTALPKWAQGLMGVWLCAVLLMGAFNYACAPLDWPRLFYGPPWAQQVQQWRQDPSKPLAIWPAGWQVTLPPKP